MADAASWRHGCLFSLLFAGSWISKLAQHSKVHKFFARINLKNIAEGDFMVDFSAQYRLIGARIAYFRKLKRYTQEELAFRASISTSYLSRIERGIYSKGVPISTLMQISKALDIDIKLLFEEKI